MVHVAGHKLCLRNALCAFRSSAPSDRGVRNAQSASGPCKTRTIPFVGLSPLKRNTPIKVCVSVRRCCYEQKKFIFVCVLINAKIYLLNPIQTSHPYYVCQDFLLNFRKDRRHEHRLSPQVPRQDLVVD